MSGRLSMRNKDPIPTFRMTVPGRDKQTVTSVLRNLCQSLNLPVQTRDQADILSDRVIQHILEHTHNLQCNCVLLLVDEMQRLQLIQLEAFAALYDLLRECKVSLTIIFIGNEPECWPLLEQVQANGKMHLYGRFFTRHCVFHGLTTHHQLKHCLAQYDLQRFPQPDGPTYTEYFLEEAVQHGWKMTSLSQELWQVYQEYQHQYQLKDWGMQYFISTVNTLLTDFLPRYGVDAISPEMVRESFKISGLISSMIRPVKV